METKSENQREQFDCTVDDLEGRDPFDDQLIINLIKRCKTSGKAKRQKLARDWFRSELFYNGVQWITFDSKLRRWREIGLKKTTPKPVTNTYASYCDIFGALLCSLPLEVTYRPLTSGDELDQIKTNIANELVEAIQQVTKLSQRQREAAPLLARQGEVFLIPRVMADGPISKPQDEMTQKTEESEPSFEVAKDLFEAMQSSQNLQSHEQSEELMQPIPEEQILSGDEKPIIPKIAIDVASSFECYMDEEADTLEDSLHFIREKSYDVSILKELYPEQSDKIKPSQKIAGDISRYFAGTLQRLTSGEFGTSGYFISSDQTGSTRANLSEFWHDPCKNYPKGIYAILINDNILVHKGPLQYSDNGKYKKNIVHLRAKKRTKNIHGRTPMDDAIPKQVQRNKLESFIELIVYRMAAPHWLLPKDCGIEAISGEPGTSIQYNRVSASQTSVLKPELITGTPPHPVLIEWLKKIDEDTEYILGLTKALLGELPPGTPAARALELLMQRSRDRHGDVFAEWNSKWAECVNMLLKIVREVKPVDLFKSTKRTFGGYSVKRFDEGDYDLNIDIIPETEAPSPPRSTAAEIQLVEDVISKGLFNLPPNIQYEILERFSLDYLMKPLKSDKEYVSRENFELTKLNKIPLMKVFDNHPMHFEEHRIFRQSDDYLEWANNYPQLAEEFEQHILAHQEMMNQNMQQQQPQQPRLAA